MPLVHRVVSLHLPLRALATALATALVAALGIAGGPALLGAQAAHAAVTTKLDATWLELTPPAAPPPTAGAASAYDAGRGQVVMFGGLQADAHGAATWAWDGSSWVDLKPEHSPPARAGASMAYDPVRDELVLFGGANRSTFFFDTWVFADGDWSLRLESAQMYANAGSMAFDRNLRQVVYFGGWLPGAHSDLTFAWDGATWSQLTPATSPPARDAAGMAYDRARDVLVLFGGHSDDGYLGDTWTWDGVTWTQEFPRRSPTARYGPAMSSFGRNVMLFGGGSTAGVSAETRVFKRGTWRVLRDSEQPSSRAFAAAVWDPDGDQAVLFGGSSNYGTDALGDTWALLP